MGRLFGVVVLCTCLIAAGAWMRAQPVCFSLFFPQLMPKEGISLSWLWGEKPWEATPGEAVAL